MKNRSKRSTFDWGRLISAIVFVVVMFGLVLFAMYYDPERQFSNSFFEDVSNAIQWR